MGLLDTFGNIVSGDVDAVSWLDNPFNNDSATQTTPEKQAAASASYWRGADNNIYWTDPQANYQVKNLGNYDQYAYRSMLGNEIADPNAPTGGGNTGSQNIDQPNVIGGPGGRATGDAATAAYYDDAVRMLETQAGRLTEQERIGLENIVNSYNRGRNRLGQQRSIAERDYGTNKDRNVNSYLGARNGIMQNTRATANSLQRLLGLNGAGYSSAALESAPYAAAMQGTQNLSGAQRTYGDNEASLATAWGDTERGYKNSLEDLDTQRYQQENSLRSSIAQTRASLLDKISQGKIQAGMARGQDYASAAAGRGGYQSQIDALLDQVIGYGRQYANPVLNTGNVQYKAPTQAQFSLDKFAAPVPAAGGAQSDLSPTFLGLLTGQQGERDEFGNLIGY